MDGEQIYYYCLERLITLDNRIWELAEEHGIQRTKEEADKITIMANAQLNTCLDNELIIDDPDKFLEMIAFPYNYISILFLICETATIRIEQTDIALDDALVCVEQAWYHFGTIHTLLAGGNKPVDENQLMKDTLSSIGKKGAEVRHAETRSMREFAKQHWRENIDPNLPNDKAAELLANVVCLSHRTRAEIVAEAKKEAKTKYKNTL